MLSSPTRVTPLPVTVPRLTVQYSRNTLRSPISRRVGSPLYFLSCGASPSEANWKTRLSAPIVVGPLTTACGPIQQRGPDDHVVADDRKGTDLDVGGRAARLRRDDCSRIDACHGTASDLPRWATRSRRRGTASSRPTPPPPRPRRPRVENFQMPFMLRSTLAVRISWSPGSTGRRKRALSMPAK